MRMGFVVCLKQQSDKASAVTATKLIASEIRWGRLPSWSGKLPMMFEKKVWLSTATMNIAARRISTLPSIALNLLIGNMTVL